MKPRVHVLTAAVGALLVSVLVLRPVAQATVTKPEDVGLSTERLARITEMMKRHIAAGQISGGVTLVARHGKIAHREATGVSDIDSKKPMTNRRGVPHRVDDQARHRRSDHDDDGGRKAAHHRSGLKFIPSFKNLKVAVRAATTGQPPADAPAAALFDTVPAAREVTIRDLLTHVSGLGSGPMSGADIRRSAIVRQPTDTLADYVPRLGLSALEFQPGTRWAYSAEPGFDTLGHIVEIASGQPFDQFLHRRVFDWLQDDPRRVREAGV